MVRVLIKLFLLFILVYAVVYLGYGRLEKRLRTPAAAVLPQAGPVKVVEKTKQVLQKTSNYQIILTRNIFEAVQEQKKVDPSQKKPEKVVEKEPEQTKLKLILHGTVSGSERDSRAIIVDQKEKRQDLYQIGDAVQGALITSIERGKVILEVNGKKQLLVIKDREGGGRGNSGRPTGSVFEPRKPTFAKPPSRSVFSKKDRSPPPTAVPHRRISFRKDKNEDVEPDAVEEPQAPLFEEDLEGDVEPVGDRELDPEMLPE